MLTMRVGERLIELREARKMTQYALAKAAGMAQTHVGQIEEGKIDTPNVQTAEWICVWFEGATLHEGRFNARSLKKHQSGRAGPRKTSRGR